MLVDLLIRNARILTQDPSHPLASSLLVHDGRILAVDPDDLGLAPARVIDAGGATIVPGFNDVHAHSVWFGLGLMEANLGWVRGLQDVYRIIAEAAEALGPDEWVIASGFSPLLLDGQQPDRDRLDEASAGRPVWIKHSSGHACTLNGAALERVVQGGADLSEPVDGGVVVVGDDGRPTGLLEENAMRLVQDLMLPYPLETIERALDLATTHYLSEGITSVTDAGIAGGWIGYSPREFAAYQNARDKGLLSVRMQPMMVLDALHGLAGHASDPEARGLDGGIRSGLGDDWLRLGSMKMFSDGSLLGGTAYMSEDYVGCPHNHGYLQMAPEKLRAAALEAYRAGWALAIHAIGDSALDHAIEIISEAQEAFGRNALPNRIEHGGVVRPEQLDRLADAGIVLVPQPHFITEFGDGMARLLGPERTAWSYPAKSLLDRGLPLPGSSDRPVSNGRPLDVIQSFVQRVTPSGQVYGPDERITAAQALAAYTTGSASATGTAHVKGMLAPRYLADLVFLDQDPTAVEAERIAETRVLATMVGGELRFGADAFPARTDSTDSAPAFAGKDLS